MARRMVFFVKDGKVERKKIKFKGIPGKSEDVLNNNVKRLHSKLTQRALEVSRYSQDPLGIKMDRRALYIQPNYAGGIYLESFYQGSKIFENGGPHRHWVFLSPIDVLDDKRLENSGQIVRYWSLFEHEYWYESEHYFDYHYIKACVRSLSKYDLEELLKYEVFTDIEYNPNKEDITPAIAAALLKLLYIKIGYDGLQRLDKKSFISYYNSYVSI